MRSKDTSNRDFFIVNDIIFYMSYAFILMGIAFGTYLDIFYWDEVLIILITDVGGFVFLLISFILALKNYISKNTAVTLVIAVAVILWVLSTIVTTLQGRSVENGIYSVLVITVMVGASAFLIHRQAVVLLGVINFGMLTFLTYYSPVPFLYNVYPLFAITLIGFTVVLYYYRFYLDSLVTRLNNSYDNLQIKSLELKRLKDKAELLNIQNRPFVVFGKNTAGLVHDFKNDLSLFTAARSIIELKMQRGISIEPGDLKSLNDGILRLEQRIERVKFITSAREDAPKEILVLDELVRHAVYPFTLTREVKQSIDFSFVLPDRPIKILGQRFLLLQIMENLIRNSCEAIMEQGPRGRITISITNHQNTALLSVHDTGPGIPFCTDCDHDGEDCSNCLGFEIGKTTKPNGSGYGMFNVLQALDQLNGKISIHSNPEAGTLVEMKFPLGKGEGLPVRTHEEILLYDQED